MVAGGDTRVQTEALQVQRPWGWSQGVRRGRQAWRSGQGLGGHSGLPGFGVFAEWGGKEPFRLPRGWSTAVLELALVDSGKQALEEGLLATH